MGTLVITKLAATGSTVRKGDLLVEFDRQQQERNALDRQADYQDLIEQIARRRAEQAASLAGDRTELVRAENDVQRAKLELRKNEVVSQIDAEKNQQSLEQANATLEQLRQTFELKRRAATAELRILEIQRDRAQNAMRYAQSNSARMAIHSPIDGVVVLHSIWKSGSMGEVQEGDEVRSGTPFMQVVNPVTMQVRTRVNQADVRQIQESQRVTIGLDAYPELKFNGRVDRIESVGQTSNMSRRVRSFSALIAVQGSDAKLLPGLSAAVDVELQRSGPSVIVPRDALVKDGQQYFVYVKSGGGSSRKAVQLEAWNDVDAVIESGLSEGAVVLRNPAGTSR
jgi:multidrug efflux pump subunit AcrA (membrane-fusion protein)